MIEQLIYSPFLQKNIPVKAENQAELEKYIELFAPLRNESSEDIWHIWDAVLQAHLEVLDSLREGRWPIE